MITPVDSAAASQTGLAALKSGDEERALPIVLAARNRDPGNARLWQVSALLHRALDDLAPAVAAFTRAAALAPQDARIALGRAHATLEAGLSEAPEQFAAARRLAPQDAGALIGHAAALHAHGAGEQATALLAEALAAQPSWLPGHALYARLRTARGESAQATEMLVRALAAHSGEAVLWQQLILTLSEARRHEDALAAIARARAAGVPAATLALPEFAARTELRDDGAANRLLATLPPPVSAAEAVPRIRHLLRTGRAEAAAELAESAANAPDGVLAQPYRPLAWRVLGDPRANWLEVAPGLVGVYDLADRLPPLNRLAAVLRRLHVSQAAPMDQSLRGGTQTDGPLLARVEPEIRALRAAIVGAVEQHRARLGAVDATHPQLRHRRDRRIRFAGSWSVRLTDAGRHAAHVHPAGWFSSALYVALPGDTEAAPPAGWLTLGEPEPSLGLDLPPLRTVEPRPGRLVLFPSTMWHATVPFAVGERLTVAFDVAPPL